MTNSQTTIPTPDLGVPDRHDRRGGAPMTITREDLAISYSTSDWGGPVAVVTAELPQPWTEETEPRTFELKSTKGMDRITEGGHGIHIFEMPDHHGRPDWRGAFKTTDLQQALDWFVEYLNELVERQAVSQRAEGVLSQLNGALTDFGESLNDESCRDFRAEWDRVREAFVGVDLAVRGAGRHATASDE